MLTPKNLFDIPNKENNQMKNIIKIIKCNPDSANKCANPENLIYSINSSSRKLLFPKINAVIKAPDLGYKLMISLVISIRNTENLFNIGNKE